MNLAYLRVLTNGYRRRPRRLTSHRNGGPTMRVGDRVRLITPGNPRLHGSEAIIVKLTDWGAFCRAPAAATGEYRALWTEMEIVASPYTGDFCDKCGSGRMRRAGACKVCEDCGESSGCG